MPLWRVDTVILSCAVTFGPILCFIKAQEGGKKSKEEGNYTHKKNKKGCFGCLAVAGRN